MLAVSTLGGLRFSADDPTARLPGQREAAVLVYIACEWPRAIPRGQLAEMFWPGSSEPRARHSVSQALYRLSSRLPGLGFGRQGQDVSVSPQSLHLDVREFRQLVRHGDYAAAAALYQGPFLEGISLAGAPDFDDWLAGVRAEAARLAEEAFRGLLVAAEDMDDRAGVESAAVALLRLNPLDQAAAASEIGVMLARGAVGEAARRHAQFLEKLYDVDAAPVQRILDLGARLSTDTQSERQPAPARLPLIGRTSEFEELKRRLSATQQGNGGNVLILGRAGVGKTRLCEQLLRLAAIRGFRTLGAACTPLLGEAPYAAMRQLFAGIPEVELSGMPVGAVSTLAHLLSRPLASDGAVSRGDLQPREWLYEGAATLLANCAEHSPLLLLVEDIHWLDGPSSDLLRYLRQHSSGQRILIVATARPEELPNDRKWVHTDAASGTGMLEIQELQGADIDELIAAFSTAVARSIPGEVVRAVKARAGGLPFFMLELLKSWASGSTESAPGATLPTSIELFLTGRFASLSLQSLRTAEALAVLGGVAEDGALASVAGVSRERLADAVDELRSAGFVRDQDGRTVFIHDLVRDAAYGQLGGARRRMLHARAVRALRGLRGTDLGALAMHSARAADHLAACRYAMAAAARANRLFGHAEAETFWRMAAEHGQTDRTRLRCWYELAHCLGCGNKDVEADLLFSKLIDSSGLTPAMRLAARAQALSVGSRLNRKLDLDAAFDEMVPQASHMQPSGELVLAVNSLLFVLAACCRRDLRERYVGPLRRMVEHFDMSPNKLRCLANLGTISLLQGDWNAADDYVRKMAESANGLGPYWISRVEGIRAVRALLSGNLCRADEAFKAAYRLVEAAGHDLNPAEIGTWAVVKLEMAEFDDAEDLLKSSIEWARPRKTAYLWSIAESNFGLLEYERGNWESAISHVRAAHELGGASAPAGSASLAFGILGLTAGDEEDAERYRRVLLELLSQPSAFGVDTSYGEIFLARMSEREGKVDEALERLDKAIEWYAGRDFFCHGRLELEKARLIGTRDREAGLALAREVRARAADAEGVLLLNKAEALIRELKRAEPAGGARPRGASAAGSGRASGRGARAHPGDRPRPAR